MPVYIHMQAIAVHDHGNGVFTLAIPAGEISKEANELLDSLFPHTRAQIEKALNTEAVIQSQLSEREIDQTPSQRVIDEAFQEKRRMKDLWPRKDREVKI